MVFLGGVGLEFCDGRTPFGLRRGTDAGMGSSRPRDRMLRVPAVMRGRTLAVAACFCSPLPADTTSRPVQVPLVVIAVILRNLSMSIEQHRQTLGLHAKPPLIPVPHERQAQHLYSVFSGDLPCQTDELRARQWLWPSRGSSSSRRIRDRSCCIVVMSRRCPINS